MIQIDLQPELEAQFAAEAQARGLALERYIVERLEASRAFGTPGQSSIEEAIDNIRALRKGNILGGACVKDLVNEGRKY